MTYEKFTKTGRLGCSHCYEIFSDRLLPIIKRLHGSTRHTGKVFGQKHKEKSASPKEQIENLKKMLETAIKSEEYEKAAEYRDKIKKIQSNMPKEDK
jgi:protein arginine kinase activator